MVVYKHERLPGHQAIETREDHGVSLPDWQLTDVERNGAHLECVRSGSRRSLSPNQARNLSYRSLRKDQPHARAGWQRRCRSKYVSTLGEPSYAVVLRGREACVF